MSGIDIQDVLSSHSNWLSGVKSGKRANLSGANLSGADLYGSNLYRSNLSRANLSGANLSGANLSGADLYGANLSRANLYGANLSGANLSGANLSGANLSWANLYGADLSGANLSGANLSGANLSGANLSGCTPLLADTARKYVLYVIADVKDGPRFIAGCRNFTATEALAHWGPDSARPQPAYVASIQAWLAGCDAADNKPADDAEGDDGRGE